MVTGVAVLIASAGCGTVQQAAAASHGVVKIGVLAPLTGPIAGAGANEVNGWNLYWQQHGSTIDGFKIQSIELDTAGNPAQGLTQARKLVADGVSMDVGPMLANVGYAVASTFESHKIPFFYPFAPSAKLTQPNNDPYFLRLAGWTALQPSFAAAQWACKTAKLKTSSDA